MKYTRVFAFMALAGMAGSAFATNGYFSHGYGMKSKGMAGVSTTNTEDAFGGANNPAAMAFAGNRFDLGVDLFSPRREATSTNWGGSGMTVTSESDSNYHVIPELGYVTQVNSSLGMGVTVYGNGGMNTDYPPLMGTTNHFGGNGSLGVDLMQLIVAPTAAYKVAPDHAIGVSPLLGYQRFKAEGLAFPDGMGGVMQVPNAGTDDAFGFGVRVGYLGKVTPAVTIGAAYASKMDFEEFDKYNWLFAEKGDFDIPANWNLGVSWQVTSAIRLALDYQGIEYSGVNSVGNSPNPAVSTGGPGASNAQGFGWDDINIIKVAVEHKFSPSFTLRAGYSHTDSPIEGASLSQCMTASENCGEVTMNILAPAVIEDHVTVGFSYTLASGNELTMAYMHAFENDVSGQAFSATGTPTGTDTIRMYQDSIGIQYSWKM
jgi:long-chain fatty acid transport protein